VPIVSNFTPATTHVGIQKLKREPSKHGICHPAPDRANPGLQGPVYSAPVWNRSPVPISNTVESATFPDTSHPFTRPRTEREPIPREAACNAGCGRSRVASGQERANSLRLQAQTSSNVGARSTQSEFKDIEMILQMAHEERTVMNTLCQRIAVERNSEAFDQLVRQLNDLLEKTQDPLTSEHRQKPN